MNNQSFKASSLGFVALIIGATGIGLAPILVRLSETGPVATAFYRLLLAQPIIWLLLKREQSHSLPLPQGEGRGEGPLLPRHDLRYAAIAGLLFTADLSIWHWSLKLTTVANSTFVTNLTPFFVSVAAWLLFKERVSARLILGKVRGL